MKTDITLERPDSIPALLAGIQCLEDYWQTGPKSVWYVARRKGRRCHGTWCDPANLEALATELQEAVAVHGADTIELCFPHSYRQVPRKDQTRVFSNQARGLTGIEVRRGNCLRRLAPTVSVSSNRALVKDLPQLLQDVNTEAGDIAEKAEIWAFEAHQILLFLEKEPRAVPLHRGSTLVRPEDITPDTISEMIASMLGWMLGNLRADGHLTYKYWPSRGLESEADNPIRRFMATVCLFRAGQTLESPEIIDAADRNLRFNLDRFYLQQDRRAVIQWDGSAKLGSAALAALAILHHPRRAAYEDQFQSLLHGIDDLWQQDGSFSTFHFPEGRNDNQNFYPGEALLLWASLLRLTPDPDLLDRFMTSFRYYRDWHRGARNPAFISWHTQAYAAVYDLTGDPDLLQFVFEMNDWLLPVQQWGETAGSKTLAPDLWGRFYAPDRPFGPPHASSTGVYLESLTDASRLARAVNDTTRAEAYERAMWRGIRSIRQLQFRDEADCFYVSRREKVLGGVRTEAYNNEIRVDNVQHPLMALLQLIEHPGFAVPAPKLWDIIAMSHGDTRP